MASNILLEVLITLISMFPKSKSTLHSFELFRILANVFVQMVMLFIKHQNQKMVYA